MKKEQLLGLGIDEAVARQVLEVNGADIESAKRPLLERAAAAERERDGLQARLAEADKTLKSFEGVDPVGLQQALDEAKLALEQAQARHAAELLTRDSRAETERLLADIPFVNDITRAHFVGLCEAALADPAGAGKSRQEILDELTRDGNGGALPGIFAEENPNRLLETPPSGKVEDAEAFPFSFTPV